MPCMFLGKLYSDWLSPVGIPPNGGDRKAGIPTKCPTNSGLGIIVICPDVLTTIVLSRSTSSTSKEVWSRRAALLSHIYGCCFEMVGHWAWKNNG